VATVGGPRVIGMSAMEMEAPACSMGREDSTSLLMVATFEQSQNGLTRMRKKAECRKGIITNSTGKVQYLTSDFDSIHSLVLRLDPALHRSRYPATHDTLGKMCFLSVLAIPSLREKKISVYINPLPLQSEPFVVFVDPICTLAADANKSLP